MDDNYINKQYGDVTLPLLVNDGTSLKTSVGSTRASTAYSNGGDSLNYLLTDKTSAITDSGTVIEAATGNYKPLLATRSGASARSTWTPISPPLVVW